MRTKRILQLFIVPIAAILWAIRWFMYSTGNNEAQPRKVGSDATAAHVTMLARAQEGRLC